MTIGGNVCHSTRVTAIAFSCPFCHERYTEGSNLQCTVCGIELAPFTPHDSAEPFHPKNGEQGGSSSADVRKLSMFHAGNGRGIILMVAVIGLGLFAAPWIRVSVPDAFFLTGLDLGRRLGWSWGAGIAWLVLIPVVASRRTLVELRGARVAAGFLSAIPATTVGVLVARPPQGRFVHIRFEYAWALWATLGVSIVAVVVALVCLGDD